MALAILCAEGCAGKRPPDPAGEKTTVQAPGGPGVPVRYTGGEQVLPYHDGGLRLAVGVKNYQVFRANRAHPETAERHGWTYNPAPMLANKLVTPQWWEEDRSEDGFYHPMGRALKALSYYRREDGAVVGLWKDSWTALSRDEGATWSSPVQAKSLVMASAKVWGQKTADGRYALVYNPRADNRHRWPLAIVTGDDGVTFDNLLTVCGEVPPRRYNGLDKAFGPQYVRGIVEGNGVPPGNMLWVTFSMNKDDIWISRIPLPVRGSVTEAARDDFNSGTTADLPWNLYSPKWAQVKIVDFPSPSNRSLELSDREPHDYAKAVRVFPEALALAACFKVLARQSGTGRLEIDFGDRYGWRSPQRLRFDDRGRILALDGNGNEPVLLGNYRPGEWRAFEVWTDIEAGRFSVSLDGRLVLENAELLDPVESLERLCLRTGPYRIAPLLRDPKSPGEDVSGADETVPNAVFCVDDLEIEVVRPARIGAAPGRGTAAPRS